MSVKKLFKMPNPVKITGRSSSITNSFVNGIVPVIEPSEEEIKEALSILGMDETTICCAYCGGTYTEWDHLRPLVVNKTATGYVSEIHNLVPACGKCNQSKGNQPWREWMYSDAKLSPATKKVPDIDERYERLARYEKWGVPLRVDIESIVGTYKWQQHWENCEKIKKLMQESQVLSDEIKEILEDALNSGKQEITKYFYSETTTAPPKITETVPSLASAKEEEAEKRPLPAAIDQTKAVGKLVQDEFMKLLTSGRLDSSVMEALQNQDTSKELFGVNYPVLLPIDSATDIKKGVDSNGVNRYYIKPICIREKWYLVTSQWFERNKKKLLSWMAEVI